MTSLPSLAQIDPDLRELVASGGLAGVVVGHTQGDTLSFAAHGHTCTSRGAPMTPDTIVRIHSMSKPITTVALLTLVDEGLTTLDTPLADLVPAFGRTTRVVTDADGTVTASIRNATPITIRHLLTHTAGLVYASPTGTATERLAWATMGELDLPLEAWCTRLASVPLAYAPGEGFSYGVATDVVGRIVEVITGKPLDEALHERVFSPLEMADTGFSVPDHARDRVATIYRHDASGLVPVDWPGAESFTRPTFLSGGGGLYATCADYLRFAKMLLDEGRTPHGRMLEAHSVSALHAPHVVPSQSPESRVPGSRCAFGLGVRVVLADDGSDFGPRGSYGWDGLAGTTFVVDARGGAATVCMTQILPWPTRLHACVRAPRATSV